LVVSLTVKQRIKDNLPNAAVALICVLVLAKYATPLEESEFSGGKVTGILLDLYEIGLVLFVVAFLLAFLWRRIAAVAGLLASLLCLPVFLYQLFPGVFRWLFPGEWKVPLPSHFYLDKWMIFGISMIALALFLNIHMLIRRNAQLPPHRSTCSSIWIFWQFWHFWQCIHPSAESITTFLSPR
jgi:hypothetical protein